MYRILYTDDLRENRLLIGAFLRNVRIELEFASDGEEAVNKEADTHYDLILMDLAMPNKTGLEAVQQIRAREAAAGEAGKPIVALTAFSDPTTQAECDEAGFSGYLMKPVMKDALMEELKRHLPDL